jgi:hypothetical protein
MPLILGTNSIKDTSYNVANSLRFNDDSSDFLNRTPSSAGNRRTFTISAWVKRGQVTTNSFLFGAWTADNDAGHFAFGFESAERLTVDTYSTNLLTTTRTFTDPNAWYHVVCAVDTTSGTADNRVRLYVNGVEQSNYSTRNNPSQNADLQANNSVIQVVGANYYNSQANTTHDGYMAEFCMIDGQQLAPTSFGEFDSDSPTIWKPKDVSGLTFGTNGFYQEYKQSGTSQNSSGLGADTSGQDNHFAVNNLTAIDQSTDTCTNNFCTLNPLQAEIDGTTLSEGNTKLVTTAQSGGPYSGNTVCTFGVSSGKWYWEAKLTTNPVATAHCVSVVGEDFQVSASNVYLTADNSASISYITFVTNSGNAATNFTGTRSSSSYGSAPSINDIVGVALDLDNGKIFFSVNGTWQNSGDPANGTNPASSSVGSLKGDFVFPAFGDENYSTSASFLLNFGSPAFSISSGNTDGNGYGNFEYAVPSGYFALNSKNLAEYG